jgi:hypothetical protein
MHVRACMLNFCRHASKLGLARTLPCPTPVLHEIVRVNRATQTTRQQLHAAAPVRLHQLRPGAYHRATHERAVEPTSDYSLWLTTTPLDRQSIYKLVYDKRVAASRTLTTELPGTCGKRESPIPIRATTPCRSRHQA